MINPIKDDKSIEVVVRGGCLDYEPWYSQVRQSAGFNGRDNAYKDIENGYHNLGFRIVKNK